jgi:hypothetical protein
VCTEIPPDDVQVTNLFKIVEAAVQASVTDVSDGAGDPKSGQASLIEMKVEVGDQESDMVVEKSFGLGDMLHETVADAKVVVSCVMWLGIVGSAGAECNNCGGSSAIVQLVVLYCTVLYCSSSTVLYCTVC